MGTHAADNKGPQVIADGIVVGISNRPGKPGCIIMNAEKLTRSLGSRISDFVIAFQKGGSVGSVEQANRMGGVCHAEWGETYVRGKGCLMLH